MKRLLAFLLLISHMNSSMFLPQVPEHDVYDANGSQVDDINSVVEYVMVSLGLDRTPDDEDDDTGQNFQLTRVMDCVFHPFFSQIKNVKFPVKDPSLYGDFTNNKTSLIVYDLIIPPPKTA